ncbi:MAG: hypothetical protein H7096_00500 [Flavobacterium sp.]|nr:hypothetical protein [Pedobacter sp.]
MNFLSHYYFDRETTNPEVVLGCVLPDLIRNANKFWRIHPEKKAHLFSGQEKLESLLTGWKRHLTVDLYFHSSDFFIKHTAAIRKLIAPILSGSQIRPSFLAHISLELMLDSLLIDSSLINASDFYDKIAHADRKSLKRFLEINLITDTTVFFKFFDTFLEINYLHRYNESNNLVYALNRICMRVWKDPLSEEEKFKMRALLLDYQDALKTDFQTIFNYDL